MSNMPFRQVHLDFHTSGAIDGIGSAFSREQFREALLTGHVNSITLFSKCHHGYSYHPTTANEMHPGLHFDLLGEQLAVCQELGVNAPIYLSAGFDEKDAVRHPEWLNVPSIGAGFNFVTDAGYHLLCFNTPYLERLIAQVEEIMQRYHPCGVFLDISSVRTCYCAHCLQSMRKLGMNPRNEADIHRHGELVYANYCRRVEEAVRKYSADCRIFHNAGNITRGRRDIAGYDTHLELESLPTGGWGYDHFPMSAAYVRTLGMDYLGMTGKFHTTWGEFGGFKHPNALRYETALSLALGAKCSIGDQLHPSGKMNLSTYQLIGAAYCEVEQKEPWCDDVETVSDIAVLSAEAFRGMSSPRADVGVCRILLEKKYLFDLIDRETPFDRYKLLILPDLIRIDDDLRVRLEQYLASGGRILATGESGLTPDGARFALDFGCDYAGVNDFRPSYMVPASTLQMVNGVTEYVMYEQGFNICPHEDAEVLAELAEPYFNRTAEHFCSHQHTPNGTTRRPAAVFHGQTVYLAWNLFTDYAEKGELHVKELAFNCIERLIGSGCASAKTLEITGLPDRGVTTLQYQRAQNRLIHHVLFAHTCVRGRGIEVIEDVLPVENTTVAIRTQKPKSVRLVPQNCPIPFSYENGILRYRIDSFTIHQMVEIQF